MKKRVKVNLSNYQLMTFDMGELVPCGIWEVLPGDTFQHSTTAVIRLSPMVAPVMHNITARIHHFFVPHRHTFRNETDPMREREWEAFITGGEDGQFTDPPETFNYLADTSPGSKDRLGNYLGLPQTASAFPVNNMAFRACRDIWNEYYRDQQLQTYDNTDNNLNQVRQVCWEKDQFTTSRPSPQLGDEVTIPLTGTSLVTSTADIVNSQVDTSSTGFCYLDNNPANIMTANLANTVQGATINDLRLAMAAQRLREARSRFGTRYTEYLRYAFGVNSSDARLQRPEYLGGSKALIQVSEVLQTAPESGEGSREYGVGDMYGHGISAMRSNAYRRFFEEHGYVISMISIRPKTFYTQGADRHFFKQTKEDFYQREMALIGQQEVLNGEIYTTGNDGTNREVFGWQDRYYEYRRARSHVAGDFARPELNYWHLGRIFDDQPALNADFVECNPSKRIFAEQTRHSIWAMVKHNVVARRKMARSTTPRAL